ncbi:MAG: hypothetical protein AAF702_39460, partial [Chloroflexota bacterium]
TRNIWTEILGWVHFLAPFLAFLGISLTRKPFFGKLDPFSRLDVSIPRVNKLRENGTYLPILKRQFRHKDPATGEIITYHVNIKPARLEDKQGNVKEYYPTEREELVEEALRKIATVTEGGVYLNNCAGVQFTLYQLRRELESRGHSIHLDKLIEALNICSETILEVKSETGDDVLKSTIFPELLITSRQEWLKHPKDAKCYVQFNRLVTFSINHLTYRQFDYMTFMAYRSPLARWLHKRLFHKYVYADLLNSHTLSASTIIRDSGLANAARLRDSFITIEKAMDELKAKEVIASYDKKVCYAENNLKITDIQYEIRPTRSFVAEMKAANKRCQVIEQKAALQEPVHPSNR